MLKEKDGNLPVVGEVCNFQISTGEEVMGEVINTDEQTVVLRKPVKLATSSQGVGMIPATLLGDPDQSVTYQRSHIIGYMSTRSDIEKVYKEQTSGIAIASNMPDIKTQ